MNETLLYVEDESTLAKVVTNSLRQEQFNVLGAQDAYSALQLLSSNQVDICILDVMLPDLDGFGLARQIRLQKPKVPILFLTAKDSLKDLENGFASGGNDYLRKPFDVPELVLRIRNLILLTGTSSESTTHQKEIAIGSFQFNPSTLTLASGSFSKVLSYKESEILKELLLNMNNVTARKELLLKVWGDDSFFNSRNLDVYIRKLRNYFSEDKSIQIITLKSVGYHFCVSNE